MKKLMMAAIVAASAIGAAEAAIYRWNAEVRFLPEPGNYYWYSVEQKESGTVEVNAIGDYVAIYQVDNGIAAVSGATYDEVANNQQVVDAYLKCILQATHYTNMSEYERTANPPWDFGRCLMITDLRYDHGEYGAIPEPTSGALALLGVAFLMLKRMEELEA